MPCSAVFTNRSYKWPQCLLTYGEIAFKNEFKHKKHKAAKFDLFNLYVFSEIIAMFPPSTECDFQRRNNLRGEVSHLGCTELKQRGGCWENGSVLRKGWWLYPGCPGSEYMMALSKKSWPWTRMPGRPEVTSRGMLAELLSLQTALASFANLSLSLAPFPHSATALLTPRFPDLAIRKVILTLNNSSTYLSARLKVQGSWKVTS